MQTWFIKSHWLEQDKIAYIEIIGDFHAEGMEELNYHWVEKFLDKTNSPIHTIIDATGVTNYPVNLSVLNYDSSIFNDHPNVGEVVLVGLDGNPVLKMISATVTQLFSTKFKQVGSLHEAKGMLNRLDSQLSEFA